MLQLAGLVLAASMIVGQAEERPNHQKLEDAMGWMVGEWKLTPEEDAPNALLRSLSSHLSVRWALDGQIINATQKSNWMNEDGEKVPLDRQYTYYWDRDDEQTKVAWFSTWGTSRHGVLKESTPDSLIWEWPIVREGVKGTVRLVQSRNDDGTLTADTTWTMDNGNTGSLKYVLQRIEPQ